MKTGQEVYVCENDVTIKLPQLFVMRGKTQIPVDTVYAGDIAVVTKVSELMNSITFSDKKDQSISES